MSPPTGTHVPVRVSGRGWVEGLKWPEEQQRPQRLAACRESDTIRGMYYSSVIELVRRHTSSLPDVLAEAGLSSPDFSMMGKYSLANYLKLQTLCARAMQRQAGSFEQAVYRLGRAAIDIFLESFAGKTFKLLAGKDFHRFMSAGPSAYELALSDGSTRKYNRLAERSAEIAYLSDVLGPCHHCGVFDAALALTAQPYKLEVEQSAVTDFKLRVTW